jgi:hypothetical protein
MEEGGSQGILLIADHTENHAVAQYLRTKPIDVERLRRALELLMRYWFSAIIRPKRRSR